MSLRVDQLSASMLLLATSVALLVQIYSIAYLRGDPRYPSYTALIAVFTSAMALVVTADDLLRAADRVGGHGCLLVLPDQSSLGARDRSERRRQGLRHDTPR
ncbi:MAG: hypothetical protein WKF73_14975 [Nocardioidaceae bacterium]